MEGWGPYLATLAGALFLAALIEWGARSDARRYRRQREAEDAAKAHPAE
jgi:hypothetical protein